MGWFAAVGDRKRYELPDIGGWIELRQELTIGEERGIFSDAIKGTTQTEDGKMRVEYDSAKLSFGQVIAYLADWSESEEITPSAIKALKPSIYEVIEKTVQAHVDALAKKTTKTKKAKTGAETTLPSAA